MTAPGLNETGTAQGRSNSPVVAEPPDRHDVVARLVPALLARLPAMLTEVREQLAQEHPCYARFISEAFSEILSAADGFVRRLVGQIGDGPNPDRPQLAVVDGQGGVEQVLFEEIGRDHRTQGQDVTGLLAAYRIGAHVAWRHVSAAATERAVPLDTITALTGAVFTAVDALSSASLRGYIQQETDAHLARTRLREELANLLLSARHDAVAVTAAAGRLGRRVPQQACVVLAGPGNVVARDLTARLDRSCLQVWHADTLIAIVPDPAGPGRRHRLETTLRGAGLVVGRTVPLERLSDSADLAEIAARLRRDAAADGEPLLEEDPLFVDRHLDVIIVHRDRELLAALRHASLAPLAGLAPQARDRLVTTLRSWLLHMGNHKRVASDLHVHPQTVRYRLGRLRELFGDHLDGPAARAALLVALAWGAVPPAAARLEQAAS